MGLLGLSDPLLLIRSALAMGGRDFPQGIREMKGDVRINGKIAETGSVVNIGDTVSTGPPESYAVFVVGQDAYLLRENTEVSVNTSSPDLKEKTADLLLLAKGKMLSVFGKGNKRIETPTAIAGVRGTGMYTEIEKDRSYICTCYGEFSIRPKADPSKEEILTAKHHEHPRYIYASGDLHKIMPKAPMRNHTDAELTMLEALVGRKPPFAKKDFNPYKSGGGNGGGGY